MTLKEKLFNIVFDNAWEYKPENTTPELEKIADEFAIEFAEWYLDLWNRNDSSFDDNSPQKLLEIYKREQGL